MLGNYAPNKIAVRAPNRHDYAHVRAYLANLNADMVIYLPHSFLSFIFIILLIIFSNSTGRVEPMGIVGR